jgi:hypothetical protein
MSSNTTPTGSSQVKESSAKDVEQSSAPVTTGNTGVKAKKQKKQAVQELSPQQQMTLMIQEALKPSFEAIKQRLEAQDEQIKAITDAHNQLAQGIMQGNAGGGQPPLGGMGGAPAAGVSAGVPPDVAAAMGMGGMGGGGGGIGGNLPPWLQQTLANVGTAVATDIMKPGGQMNDVMMKLMMQSFMEDIALSRIIRRNISSKFVTETVKSISGMQVSTPPTSTPSIDVKGDALEKEVTDMVKQIGGTQSATSQPQSGSTPSPE